MLKSTYKGSGPAGAPPPLLPGWTEHTAPTGHKYYYNAETKVSTYDRPSAPVAPPPAQAPSHSLSPYQAFPNLSDPNVANAFVAQHNQPQHPQGHQRGGYGRGGRGAGGRGRGGGDSRPRPQPNDKPISKVAIPGCEPWILVYTKYNRRFAYNPAKNASFWRIPDKLKDGILELDKARISQKARPEGEADEEGPKNAAPGASARPTTTPAADDAGQPADEDSSEYEEVEVTDDEGEEHDGGDDADAAHPSKRQRTDEEPLDEDAGPAEFSEADIAFQLQAMGAEYGLDPGEYDDGNAEEWPEGAEGVPFSEDDAAALFKDLLDDSNINPYNSWDKLVEEERLIDDPRYTVLPNTKARKEAWTEWSKDKIREIKELRAREEKKDPRIPYMALLQEKATPKLYWQEFKRKFRKEPAMTDLHLKDKDRENWYREHIKRLKLPEATRKSDLAALLRTMPLSALNNKTNLSRLPSQLLTDIKYISLPATVRDPFIEAYIQTLPPPPEVEEGEAAEDDEATRKAKEAKQKREQALRNHEERVRQQKHQQQRSIQMGKAKLREEERELERAMQVSKKGLQSQLATMQTKPADE